MVINMHEAKTHLSRFVQSIREGEEREIIIAVAGQPAARLVPIAPPRKRPLGIDDGLFEVPDDFDAPLPASVLARFHGE